jgi:hypothetical protein
MVIEPPSPSTPRGLRQALSWVLFSWLLAAIFGSVLGLIAGYALLAAVGISSAVQHVVGVVLLILSVLPAVMVVGFQRLRRGSRRAALTPTRQLVRYVAPQGRGFDVAGTIATAATCLAPLSQRPCVVWYLALQHHQAVAGGPYTVDWVTLWAKPHVSDIEIGYDRVRTVDSRPHALTDGKPTVTDAPGGTLTIPGGLIRMTLLPADRHRTLTFPPTAANLEIMDKEGLPAKLHEASAALPDEYRLAEYCLTTGEFVRGYQQLTTATESWMPDPAAPFQMSTLSQEQINTGASGCLAAFFLVGTLLLLLFGFLLLQR